MIRILLIDNQTSVFQSLEELIKIEEGLEVVGKAKSGEEGIKLAGQLQPEVAIIGLTMPLKNVIQTTYSVNQNYPQTKVIIFDGSDCQMFNEAILAGAKGYLLINSSREDLIAAIYAVRRNSVYIGKGILDRVQLSYANWQSVKIRQIDSWLAREVLDLWFLNSFMTIPIAEEIVANLNLNQSSLSQMTNYLRRQAEKHLTSREERKLRLEKLLIEIEDTINPEQKLIDSQARILDLFEGRKNINYSARLQDNVDLLRIAVLEKLKKIISSLWQHTAPFPLLKCLRLVENHLNKEQQSLEQKNKRWIAKKKAAWQALNHLLKLQNNNLPQKLELCQKAISFIYQCRINAELNKLLAQLIFQTIIQLKVYLEILDQTCNLLLESKKKLAHQYSSDIIAFAPFFKQVKDKNFLEKLRQDLEKSIGHSLNQWGASESISTSQINEFLIKKLKPISQENYLILRKEALAISFLEYSEYKDRKLIIEDEPLIDYWET